MNREARILLTAGMLAGPLYIAVVILQALTRDGFDLSRHPASMLSTGEHGWIQIANFALTGALFVAGAVGLRRVLASTDRRGEAPGATWGPRLIGVLGVGMIGAAYPPDWPGASSTSIRSEPMVVMPSVWSAAAISA